jgi:hypothetical protein
VSSLVPLPSVPVWGFAASLVARAVRSAVARGEFDGLHPKDRDRLVRLVEDLEACEAAWIEHRNGSSETPQTEIVGSSGSMTTEAAATVLGVTARRARQLAAAGLGVKHGGRWSLDRVAVLREVERREAS